MGAAEAELKALMIVGLDGDSAAHRALLSELSGRLRAYYKSRLTRLGRGATEAEDIVQEALIAIHTRRHTYDRSELLTPWVYAIARYKLIDYLRHNQASMTDVAIDEAEDVLATDDHAGVESAHDLQRLLNRLPDKMRTALQSVKVDGLSVAEAARQLGQTESAVKVNVHRGMKTLMNLVGREKSA